MKTVISRERLKKSGTWEETQKAIRNQITKGLMGSVKGILLSYIVLCDSFRPHREEQDTRGKCDHRLASWDSGEGW